MADLTKKLPESPGVYIFKGAKGKVLYIGKAANIKRRVKSYYLIRRSLSEGGRKASPTSPRLRGVGDAKVEKLLADTKKVDFKKTDTAIEALILEAGLIKKHKPRYNVREKDDKSFLYVEITDDEMPRVMLVRGKDKPRGTRYGPFTSAESIRKAMRIIRRIFPYNVHPPSLIGRLKRPCFDAEIGLCPGTCIGVADPKETKRNLKHIKLFFGGKKERVIKSLERNMNSAAARLDYEEAERLRRQMFALRHIQDIALITDNQIRDSKSEIRDSLLRIEGYDISNISGTSAVGSMVVFVGGEPSKDDYRKFRIRTVTQSDDVGMLKEVIRRRLQNSWPQPDLMFVDGGKGQVNAVRGVLEEHGVKLPVVGIAKGPTRKKNEFVGRIPKGVTKKLLMQVRDEAHRFAIRYHRKLRSGRMLK